MSEKSNILDMCRGMSASQIRAQLPDVDIDELTKLLVTEFGERTNVPRLPSLPFRVRHTMYGDDGVTDWVLEYTHAGYTVAEVSGDCDVHVHLRWEHWEDAIRVLNGDGQLLSLVNTRRVTLVDTTPAVVRYWFGAVRLPMDDERQRASAIHLAARDACMAGDKPGMEHLAKVGIDTVLWAVAHGEASMIDDAGLPDGLKGQTLRWEVLAPGEPAAVEATFSTDGHSPVVRVVEFSSPRAPSCLVFRWKSYEGWLRNIGPRNTIAKAVAAGELEFDGQQELLQYVMQALRSLAPQVGRS